MQSFAARWSAVRSNPLLPTVKATDEEYRKGSIDDPSLSETLPIALLVAPHEGRGHRTVTVS